MSTCSKLLIGPVRRVSGMAAQLVLPGDNPDVASLVLEHESGAISNLTASYASASEYYMMNVYGKEASAYYDLFGGLRYLRRGEAAPRAVSVTQNDTIRKSSMSSRPASASAASRDRWVVGLAQSGGGDGRHSKCARSPRHRLSRRSLPGNRPVADAAARPVSTITEIFWGIGRISLARYLQCWKILAGKLAPRGSQIRIPSQIRRKPASTLPQGPRGACSGVGSHDDRVGEVAGPERSHPPSRAEQDATSCQLDQDQFDLFGAAPRLPVAANLAPAPAPGERNSGPAEPAIAPAASDDELRRLTASIRWLQGRERGLPDAAGREPAAGARPAGVRHRPARQGG